MIRDPGALAIAAIAVFILTGAAIYLPWVVALAEVLR
jgi:hypothetical protein